MCVERVWCAFGARLARVWGAWCNLCDFFCFSTMAAPETRAAPPIGALVPDLVMTPAEYRRQRRERLFQSIEDALVSAADCVLENACPPALFLVILGVGVHGFATLVLFREQVDQPEPFTTCVVVHFSVHLVQVAVLAVAAVLGNTHLTCLFIGTSNRVVQPRRVFLLTSIAMVQGIFILPLVAPTINPRTHALAPAFCHVDQPAPPDAARHVVFVRLLCHVVFAQAVYLIGMAMSIAVLLVLGLTARDPWRLALPVGSAASLIGTSFVFYYVNFGRQMENAIVDTIAVADRCSALTISHSVGFVNGESQDVVGGLYGPKLSWALGDPAPCGELKLHAFWGAWCVTCAILVTILLF
jgi:hypothetical protein